MGAYFGHHRCFVLIICFLKRTITGQYEYASTSNLPTLNPYSHFTGVIAFDAGGQFTCALTKSGNLYCWGYNWAGQLGTNDMLDKHNPTAVTGLGTGDKCSIIFEVYDH